MKKTIAILGLSAALALGLMACSGDDSSSSVAPVSTPDASVSEPADVSTPADDSTADDSVADDSTADDSTSDVSTADDSTADDSTSTAA